MLFTLCEKFVGILCYRVSLKTELNNFPKQLTFITAIGLKFWGSVLHSLFFVYGLRVSAEPTIFDDAGHFIIFFGVDICVHTYNILYCSRTVSLFDPIPMYSESDDCWLLFRLYYYLFFYLLRMSSLVLRTSP